VVGVGGVLYAFGTPTQAASSAQLDGQSARAERPSEDPAQGLSEPAAEESPAPEPSPETASESPAGRSVPAPDPSVPLAIEIPGCVCHSDDPKIVEEHAEYRMNQCAGCHAGEVPTGQ